MKRKVCFAAMQFMAYIVCGVPVGKTDSNMDKRIEKARKKLGLGR